MANSIGDFAVKVALLKTLPGEEFRVKRQLEDACKLNNIDKYIFYKGLGTFDIVLLYITDDFGYHLTNSGPIYGVLKSNLLLCYPYFSISSKSFFNKLSCATFAGFSLIKVNPSLKNRFPDIDKEIRELAKTQFQNSPILGTLGANEIIVIIPKERSVEILDSLYNLGHLSITRDDETHSIVMKTLSFLTLNYTYLPNNIDKYVSLETISNVIGQREALNDELIGGKNSINISCELTVKPPYIDEVVKYFKSNGYKCKDIAGKRDLLIEPKRKISWKDYLSCLLFFRQQYSDKITSTNTRVIPSPKKHIRESLIDFQSDIKPVEFTFNELIDIFGEGMAPVLANHFYTINALMNNPLCGFVYADMSRYPRYILDYARTMANNEISNTAFVEAARQSLIAGAELRSYGTYQTIEEVTGRFSEFRGGCQLALLAMEYLPYNVIENFYKNIDVNSTWNGFIIVKDPKFSQRNEVINVPAKALVNPLEWWPLYHEIGHVIIGREQIGGHEGKQIIQSLLSNFDNRLAVKKAIVELTAEIIGFEIGFYGNFELFLKLLWNHLNQIDPFQKPNIKLSSYAVRTFFVEQFCGLFRDYDGVNRITEEQFKDIDTLYSSMLTHMTYIENVLRVKLFNEPYFTAADNVKFVRELFPYMKLLSTSLPSCGLCSPKEELDDPNTNQVFTSVSNGKIWFKGVSYPKAILYKILTEPIDKFNAKIAFIITMANQHMDHFRERFYEGE